MSLKDLQQRIVTKMRGWQKLEDHSVASTGKVIQQTENPLIRLVMEIIQQDSLMHHRVQEYIAGSLESNAIELSSDELVKVWDNIEAHIKLEKKMASQVTELLGELEGTKMVLQEYFLKYLEEDEKKHDRLLDQLEGIKRAMIPT